MADINKVFAEAQKLNWNIESLLRLSSFETYGDLSGLHIDYEDGEQLFLIEELREIMEKLSTVNHSEYYPLWEPPVSRFRATRKFLP